MEKAHTSTSPEKAADTDKLNQQQVSTLIERGPSGTALYVHLPFCETKCHYCDFFSVPAEGQDIDGTLDAVLSEARTRAPRDPRTVFIGGGTPSLLSMKQLTYFLTELESITGFSQSATEVTLESNPESVTEEKVRLMLDHGVKRLSIGFQSLESKTLELFGRVHSVDQSFRAYDAARSAGMEDINLDMIYAAPGHNVEAWRSALQRVLALGPQHLSAYNLAFEEDTVFSRWLRDGKLKPLPEEVELEMFHNTREITSQHGLHSYEISNYALPGRACVHNENYWANGEYVGIGPSAVSYVHGVRGGSPRGITTYNKRVEKDGHAMDWSEQLDPRSCLGETWWLGLRRSQGVSPQEARTTSGFTEEADPTLEQAEQMVQHGLLEYVDERYRLTAKGIPLADRVASEFLLSEPSD